MYHGHYKNSQQHNSDNNQKSVPILDFRGPYVKLCCLGGGWVKNEWNAFRVYSVSNQAHFPDEFQNLKVCFLSTPQMQIY